MNIDHEAIADAQADLDLASARFDELCAQFQKLRADVSDAAESRRAALRKLRSLRNPDGLAPRELELETLRQRIAEATKEHTQ